MKNYNKTDYAINTTNPNAIVYRFADGTVRNITVEDFGGDEEAFRKWKEISDNDYLECNRHTYNTTRLDVSIEGIDETKLCSVPSPEDMLIDEEETAQFSTEMREFWKLLTDVQKRRLYLFAFTKMSFREIAKSEGVNHMQICRCFTNISKKLKKFEKHMLQNGKKITLGERINYFERKNSNSPEKNDDLTKSSSGEENAPNSSEDTPFSTLKTE